MQSLKRCISRVILPVVFAMTTAPLSSFAQMGSFINSAEKELYLPAKVWHIPEGNDYNDTASMYSYKRMVQSANIAIFWAKEFGDDPSANPDSTKRFNVSEALTECERFYNYYVNELQFLQKGKSLSDKYKIILYVIGGKEGTAFGGGTDDKIGMLWTPAARIQKAPYGALAHELGHSFQYLSRADNGKGPRGAIIEMSAQYLLWQVYPAWMTFENYHLVDFMKKTHYAFLHPTNMYHSPYVIEYWSHKHGKTFFSDLCRNTEDGEDPVITYKRLNKLNQDQFNDEMFDAYRKFITWDLERIEKVASGYANQHSTRLVPAKQGWYRIAASHCPQNYGYNGIPLKVPATGTKVKLNFRGIAGAEGYNAIQTDKAGWRYGFIAHKKDGTRVYGKLFKKNKGTATFTVPADTEHLWLIVSGAPTKHWPVVMGRQKTEAAKEEQWPYEIKLAGTSVDDGVITE